MGKGDGKLVSDTCVCTPYGYTPSKRASRKNVVADHLSTRMLNGSIRKMQHAMIDRRPIVSRIEEMQANRSDRCCLTKRIYT